MEAVLDCVDCGKTTNLKWDEGPELSKSLEAARRAGWLPHPSKSGKMVCPECKAKYGAA